MDDADIPHADGVHTARVDVDGDVFARKILSAMPNVEVLETRAVTIDRWFIDAPTAGYRLRCLHILTYWGQDAIPLVQLLDLLDHAPLLETLKVAEISITSSVGTLRVVTHMRLSTFHLASATADENDAVFSHLTLPALRSLSYVGDDYRPLSMHCPSNMAFLERSGCILESLSFRQWRVDETDLMVMLTIQQALITLQLNFFPDEDSGSKQPIPMAILEFLSLEYKGGSDRPLPALTFLTLVVLPHHLEAVARLVQSRSAEEAKKSRITALRKVDIQVHIRFGIGAIRKKLSMTTRL
ncbi:hypothetical protein CPB85DRAFT_1352764 [Mucidula mucida]|nr:hypothetical protein CPB85DRAFT_1352764 [Mucidula mucida]